MKPCQQNRLIHRVSQGELRKQPRWRIQKRQADKAEILYPFLAVNLFLAGTPSQ
jgi:hypothetical protein